MTAYIQLKTQSQIHNSKRSQSDNTAIEYSNTRGTRNRFLKLSNTNQQKNLQLHVLILYIRGPYILCLAVSNIYVHMYAQ